MNAILFIFYFLFLRIRIEAKLESFLFAQKCIQDEKFSHIDLLISDLTASDEKLLTIVEIFQDKNITFTGTKSM
jgi:hypothetical protein